MSSSGGDGAGLDAPLQDATADKVSTESGQGEASGGTDSGHGESGHVDAAPPGDTSDDARDGASEDAPADASLPFDSGASDAGDAGSAGDAGAGPCGSILEFSLAMRTGPFAIAMGPDGNWFTESGASAVGQMTTSGTLLQQLC